MKTLDHIEKYADIKLNMSTILKSFDTAGSKPSTQPSRIIDFFKPLFNISSMKENIERNQYSKAMMLID